jgi:hypothetical protein
MQRQYRHRNVAASNHEASPDTVRHSWEHTVPCLLPPLPNDTRLHIFHLLAIAVTVLLPANILRNNRASSAFRYSSRFCGLVVGNEQLALLAIASRQFARDLDDGESTFEAVHLVEDIVHFLERAAGGFGLVGRCQLVCGWIVDNWQMDSTYVEEVDAGDHEGVDHCEDDVRLECQVLAFSLVPRRSGCLPCSQCYRMRQDCQSLLVCKGRVQPRQL